MFKNIIADRVLQKYSHNQLFICKYASKCNSCLVKQISHFNKYILSFLYSLQLNTNKVLVILHGMPTPFSFIHVCYNFGNKLQNFLQKLDHIFHSMLQASKRVTQESNNVMMIFTYYGCQIQTKSKTFYILWYARHFLYSFLTSQSR